MATIAVFIDQHGYVKYAESLPYPRVPPCEICGIMDGTSYFFDHCHLHGWVRGIVCPLCNSQLRAADSGTGWSARYMLHWAKCPDCRAGRWQPPVRRPKACSGCDGSRYIWIGCLGRLAPCPACGDVK
jgi:hypothetical protein